MKKFLVINIILIFTLGILSSKATPVFIEKIDLKIKGKELAIVFLPFKECKSFLLVTKRENILINLIKPNSKKIYKYLKQFNVNKLDNIYNVKELSFGLVSEQSQINIINEKNLLIINYLTHNFCIYQSNNKRNFKECDYIYLLSSNHNVQIDNDQQLILYSKLNKKFLEKIYDRYNDSYYIDPNNYTII
ncbi:MAG: hypothetical protein RSB72_02465, partial [Bacilli bacterium]